MLLAGTLTIVFSRTNYRLYDGYIHTEEEKELRVHLHNAHAFSCMAMQRSSVSAGTPAERNFAHHNQ